MTENDNDSSLKKDEEEPLTDDQKEYLQTILHEPCIICGKKIPDHEPFTELFACMNKLDSHKAKLKTWFSANLKIGETTNGKHTNKSED